MGEEFIENILAASDDTKIEIVDPTKINTESESDKTITKESETNSEKAAKTEPSIEELATQLGWRADYNGEDSVDASTFILRSREIQDTMKTHNKELKTQVTNLQGSVDALKEHNERVYKAEVKRLQSKITDLQKQKRAAVELADVNKVAEIDAQLEDTKKDLNKSAEKSTPISNPIFDAWVADNEWYLTNDEMAAYADTIGQQYAGAPLDRVYKIVRQKVAEVFPEAFENKQTVGAQKTNLEKAIGPTSPVEGPKKKGNAPTFTEANLTPAQISIMNQFVKTGVMTKEQYIKDIAKMQED